MKNLLENLTAQAKRNFETAKGRNKATNIIKSIELDLSSNVSFFQLKYETIFNLNMLGLTNGYRPSDIKQLFND
jgi:hypothetical protein